jgi:ADP-ribosylglycohydrolase
MGMGRLSRMGFMTRTEETTEEAIEAALLVWKESAADFVDCLIGAKNLGLGL